MSSTSSDTLRLTSRLSFQNPPVIVTSSSPTFCIFAWGLLSILIKLVSARLSPTKIRQAMHANSFFIKYSPLLHCHLSLDRSRRGLMVSSIVLADLSLPLFGISSASRSGKKGLSFAITAWDSSGCVCSRFVHSSGSFSTS